MQIAIIIFVNETVALSLAVSFFFDTKSLFLSKKFNERRAKFTHLLLFTHAAGIFSAPNSLLMPTKKKKQRREEKNINKNLEGNVTETLLIHKRDREGTRKMIETRSYVNKKKLFQFY